jgi:hypothetical protein
MSMVILLKRPVPLLSTICGIMDSCICSFLHLILFGSPLIMIDQIQPSSSSISGSIMESDPCESRAINQEQLQLVIDRSGVLAVSFALM